MKKRKRLNLLKLGVFLFGISLLLWNCEDDKTEGLTEVELYKEASLVNTKLVSQKLGLGENNIFIRWDKPTVLVLEKNNQGGVYQYDIEQKEPVSNNSNLFVDKLTFKLIVREKEGAIEDVQIYRYEPFKESLNTAPSEIAKKGFSGMKFIFNELAELEDIYTYKLGKKISSFNETKSDRIDKHKNILYPKMDDSEFDSCLDLNGKPLEGCNSGGGSGSGSGGGYVTETTRHYTDWYNRCDSCTSNDGEIYNYGGINYIYVHTKYNGSTTRWVWVSSGGNRYVDVYNSNSPSGGGPVYDGEDREYSSGGGNNGYELPCPIGFEKVGDNCVKIVESYDDQIINNLTGKAKCVYEKLKAMSTDFKNMIQKFDGEFPVSHLKFTINNNLGNNVFGETQLPVNYVTEIQINGNGLSSLSDLGAATTFAHELIHAEIFRKMLSAAKKGDLNYLNSQTYTTQDRINYVNSLKNNFPGLYDYYWKRYKSGWNHNMMAIHYRTTIADIIQSFDNNRLPRSTYESVAWAGLGEIENNQSTVAWHNLTSTEQQAITDMLNKYFFNGTSNCN